MGTIRRPEQEITLLRELCRSDHMAYLPQGSSITALREFDALVASLQQMKKAAWIKLQVDKSGKRMGGYRQKYTAAVARCNKHGKEALRLLGAEEDLLARAGGAPLGLLGTSWEG